MNKYDNYSKEDLIALLNKQDKELARKKYGLVWDNEKVPEQVVLNCQKNLPVLKNIKDKDIVVNKTDNDYNIMIEGDNYHSLQVLNFTHKGKIDVIYIDPPYNTGNNDFCYNDKYVDKEDGYRHSKWLNFMEKRLELAKNLLSEQGIIFISIDDNEQANLKLLCDKIFNVNNYIGTIARVSKKGGNKGTFIKPKKDYVLVYCNNVQKIDKIKFGRFNQIPEPEWKEEEFKGQIRYFTQGECPYRAKLDVRANQRYYIKCPDESLIIPPGNVFPDIKEDGAKVTPLTNDDKCWTFSQKRYFEERDNNAFIFTKTNKSPFLDQNGNKAKWNIYKKVFKEELMKDNGELYKKEILSDYIDSFPNSQGTNELDDLDIDFSYPKPVNLIKYFIEITEKDTNTLILDFFAGSGTTAQAVLELNKQDGGNRKFIICTNNENNIAENVCYPRISKVINGYYKKNKEEFIEGLSANMKYFKTDFVEIIKNITQTKINLTKKCTEILCLKNGIFNCITKKNSYTIHTNNTTDSYLCIFYDFIDDSVRDFIDEIKKIQGQKLVYMFSINNFIDESLFENIDNLSIEPIPHELYNTYLKIIGNK